MDPAAIGFLGVLIGALIGWLASLATARRAHEYDVDLWRREREAQEDALRKALGEEMRGNIALLTTARQKSHHGLLERSSWTAAAGLNFRQDQSRKVVMAAYVAGAQYDTAVRQIPPMGGGNIRSEATNLASDLAKDALDAFVEAERLYGANGEDQAHPNPFAQRAAERAAASSRERTLRARIGRAVAAFRQSPK
ncbi:MAG TPA: hypothetical protein VGR87_04005 [Candidatus Limnocylindria bacterium]|nr:hypothetical protein [Candidatus Limnocylindria bacterium]